LKPTKKLSPLAFVAVASVTLFINCGGSSFSGVRGTKKQKPAPSQSDVPLPGPETVAPGSALRVQPDVDYEVCGALPASGKRGVGQCNSDEVVVIVNDGTHQEMTCCPISANVISQDVSEQNLRRQGKCGPDEVATGVESLATSTLFCSKVDTRFFKTEVRGSSIYAKNTSVGHLGTLARAYNQGDCCVCPEGTIVTGNHSPGDNRCTDECVAIVVK